MWEMLGFVTSFVYRADLLTTAKVRSSGSFAVHDAGMNTGCFPKLPFMVTCQIRSLSYPQVIVVKFTVAINDRDESSGRLFDDL